MNQNLVGMPIDKAPKTRRSQRVPREGPLPEEPPGLRGAGFVAFFHRGLSPCAGVYTVPSWPGKGGESTAPSSRKLARHGLFLVIALAIGRAVEPASIFNPTVFVGP